MVNWVTSPTVVSNAVGLSQGGAHQKADNYQRGNYHTRETMEQIEIKGQICR